MNKCRRYPNCKCYEQYEKPAREIDPKNGWRFVKCVKEVEHAILALKWITDEKCLPIILPYFKVLPQNLHALFAEKINKILEVEMSWKMPYPEKTTSLIRAGMDEAIRKAAKKAKAIEPTETLTRFDQSEEFEKKLTVLAENKNKFSPTVPMEIVISHFRVLTERKNKSGEYYLTKKQFVNFIERGFLGNKRLGKQTINYCRGEKGFLIKRFYEFFVLAVSKYSEKNKKEKYIDLISDCFDNWEPSSITLLFKPQKTKESW